MRFKLTLEYDGGPFVGWQRQTNGLGVQQVVEQALAAFCGEAVTVHAAGRTDAGVHALGQVIHFDLAGDREAERVMGALNFHLKPHPVAVIAADAVHEDFHARFDATARHYRYRIINRRPPLVLERGRAWWVPMPLDHQAMAEAARHLVGRHDFTTFRAAQCQARSPLKTLDRLDVMRHGDEVVVIAQARSFLHHQVRSMVGTLVLVGKGQWRAGDVARALRARDRAALGLNAPPQGLYLERVLYDSRA